MTRESLVRLTPLAAFALLALAGDAVAQTTELHGRVVNASNEPIAGATITLAGIRYSIKSDSLGQFRFAGPPGSTLVLMIRATGFRDDSAAVVLSRGRPVVRDFVLVPDQTPLPEASGSDRVLRGRVTTTNDEPVGYANIQINGGRRYLSDDSGRFTMPITAQGSLSLLFRRIGFEPQELKLDALPDTALLVRMKALAMVLPEQRITTGAAFVSLDLHGFYRRMRDVERGINHGYFITPEELDFRKPAFVTAAVEQLPTVRIRPIAGGLPLNRKMRIEDRNGCPMTVYLDRIRIQPTMVRGRNQDEEVNTIVQTSSVAGIEVYPRAIGAPPEYQANNGTCGIVLIWTK